MIKNTKNTIANKNYLLSDFLYLLSTLPSNQHSPPKSQALPQPPNTNSSFHSKERQTHINFVPAKPSKGSHLPFSAIQSSNGHIYPSGAQEDKSITTQSLSPI
ncbi:hypothetical protein ACB098_01G264600 [Castanea mollissima]